MFELLIKFLVFHFVYFRVTFCCSMVDSLVLVYILYSQGFTPPVDAHAASAASYIAYFGFVKMLYFCLFRLVTIMYHSGSFGQDFVPVGSESKSCGSGSGFVKIVVLCG